ASPVSGGAKPWPRAVSGGAAARRSELSAPAAGAATAGGAVLAAGAAAGTRGPDESTGTAPPRAGVRAAPARCANPNARQNATASGAERGGRRGGGHTADRGSGRTSSSAWGPGIKGREERLAVPPTRGKVASMRTLRLYVLRLHLVPWLL